MARRLPGIRQRMETVAFELFASQGYAATTPAQIAARAGTTERTFYRHFGDRAGVAFGYRADVEERFAARIRAHRVGDSPLLTVCRAVQAAAEPGTPDAVPFRQRVIVIRAEPQLRDRASAHFATLTTLAVSALCTRGVAVEHARFAAEVGLAVSRVALADWVDGRAGGLEMRFRDVIEEAAERLTEASARA